MALTLTITDAGRAALVNADHDGTLPVTLDKIGVTDQSFTASATDTTLPGEIKRLDTFAGEAVADDTLHVTIRDDSAATYTLRGFALYLTDGTLFGLYGQSDPLLEKSAQSMLLLAADVVFADIDATSLSVGDTDFMLPPATETVDGVIRLATTAEAKAGSNAAHAMTPKRHKEAVDHRFGEGAPSSFFKGLMLKASASALRAALAIKGAALHDTGAGNGLDADQLDGEHGAYYLDWGNFDHVPSSFPPANHEHSASDITSGRLPVARGGTGRGSLTAGYYLIGAGTSAAGLKKPADVRTDIGAAAKSHSHAMGDINGLSSALSGKMFTSWKITAGNGLTGGGSGTRSRTVSLGKPSTITGSSANSASGSSHTHQLDISRADIGAAPDPVTVSHFDIGIAAPNSNQDSFPGSSNPHVSLSDVGAQGYLWSYSTLASFYYSNARAFQLLANKTASQLAMRSWNQGVFNAWREVVFRDEIGTAAAEDAGYFAKASHHHSASDITSGKLGNARLPRHISITGITLSSYITASSFRVSNDPDTYVYYSAHATNSLGFRAHKNSARFYMTQAGDFEAPGNVSCESVSATDFTASSSDPRLKDHLIQLTLDWTAVDRLGLWQWDWNAKSGLHGKRGAGARSDEVREVFPQVVHRGADGYDTVDYGKLGTALAITAHQRIKALEARVGGQQREMEELAARIRNLESRA